MKTSEMIVSKFLKKSDFEDSDQVVTIKDIRLEEMQGTSETKWVLYFNELAKGLVLNTTSIRVLEAAFGNESDDWKGKRVKIYVDPNVSFQGRIVGGLRLQTPKKSNGGGGSNQQRHAVPQPQPPPPAEEDFSDPIPF